MVQVEAVTAMIVHMLKLKEIAGHLRVEPSLNVQLIGFLSFLRWILLLILPTRPYPSKRQCQQGQKREMDNFCWEPVPHCHTWARAAQRYWKMLEVDVWNVLLFQTFSASNVLMWLRPTVKESDPLTLGSSELRNHKGHRWNLYKLVASHCLQQVEEFRMIYLAVSNFKSSIVPNVPEQDPSKVSIESSPSDVKSIDVSLWHFASKASTQRGKGSFDARPTDLVKNLIE